MCKLYKIEKSKTAKEIQKSKSQNLKLYTKNDINTLKIVF